MEFSPRRVLAVAAATTALAVLASCALPDEWSATGVGLVFFGVPAWLVLRRAPELTSHYGLSLGGVLEPYPIDWRRALADAARAAAWAGGMAALVFPPFVVGFQRYWHVSRPFVFHPPSLDEVLGQLMVVALPEEAFYRGLVMTGLDDSWGRPVNVLGARLGWGMLVSSAIFALGHVLTEPHAARLAVFFPALAFAWLRARTGGIGAGVVFHAACNVLASTLLRGYGLLP